MTLTENDNLAALEPMNNDEKVMECFADMLCYYHARETDVPPRLRLILALNRWPNPAMACMELPKMVKNKKISREMTRALTHVQSLGG